MKVLMLNGSWNQDGSTRAGLDEMAKVFAAEGVETEIVTIGGKPIADCMACGKCAELKRCVFADDGVNAFAEKAKDADGFVFGSPVYYAHPSGRIQSFLDRLFFSTMRADGYAAFHHKPVASIVVAQVRDHLADDRRREQLLERVPRAHEGRRAAGSRRSSDAAQPRAKHGLRDEVPEGRTRRGHPSARERKRGLHQRREVAASDCPCASA